MSTLQQQRSVGDTFTVVHRVAVPSGSVVQPRVPTDSNLVTLLGAPAVTREGDSVRIAYSVAVWAPGSNELVIPGAIIVARDGRIDTLPDARVMIDVASVLPAGQDAATIAPRAARPWLARGEVTWLPFLVLLPLVMAAVAAAWWWRRRRGPLPPPPPVRVAPAVDAARLAAWLEAGEARLVVDHLERALAEHPAAVAWHADAAGLRYAPADGGEIVALARSGLRLLSEQLP